MKEQSVQNRLSAKFNALSFEDRKNLAGMGYSLAQLTTIIQVRLKNKEAWKNGDRKLAEWQKNIEQHIQKEFLDD